MAQLDSFLVHQRADVLGRDRLVALGQQRITGLRYGERGVHPTLRDDAFASEARHHVAAPDRARVEALVDSPALEA